MRAAPAPARSKPDLSALADQLWDLDEKIDVLKALERQRKKLAEQFLAAAADTPADQALEFEGRRGMVTVTARARERSIKNLAALFKRLGQVKFLGICRVPLSSLDEILAPADQAPFLAVEQTGPRRVLTTAKVDLAA